MAFFATTSTVGPVYVNTPHGHLRDIAAFLTATPEAWTKGNEARTGDGNGCDPMSPWARSWCMLGLMERFIPDNHTRRVALGMLMRVMPKLKGCTIPVHAFNDNPGRKLADAISILELAATVPPGAPMDQDEYCHLSKLYSRAVAQSAAAAVLHKALPDWETFIAMPLVPEPESDPITEAKTALKDFDELMSLMNLGGVAIKKREILAA